MAFPSGDLVSGYGDYLFVTGVAAAIIKARPDLADKVTVDDSRPLVSLPLKQGAVLAAKIRDGGVTRWMVGVPNRRGDVDFIRPDGLDNFAAEMIAAFDRLRGAGR